MTHTPTFSVIIATRNRPALFRRALASICAQDFPSFEIIVVDDGTSDAMLADYGDIASLDPRIRHVVTLPTLPTGHGPSYALNTGIAHAQGHFLAFLDDDDEWVDPGHLARAYTHLSSEDDIDLYFGAQSALSNGAVVSDTLWLNTLPGKMAAPLPSGAYAPDIDIVMSVPGFCHVNTLIVRRTTMIAIDGMDPHIRWESDRDLFLRLIDVARGMRFHPAIVAHHHIPDPAKAESTTTSMPTLAKLLDQRRVLDKAALTAKHPHIRAHGREHGLYTLKKLALACYAHGKDDAARYYAAQAVVGLSLKWRMVSLLITLRLWPRGG